MLITGGIAAAYGGYLLNACYKQGVDINSFMERFNVVTSAPFANYWDESSIKLMVGAVFAYVIAILMYLTGQKNYMPGKEYGTAVFAEPKLVSKKFADKEESRNRILSQNLRMSMDTRKTRLNLNYLVIGGSGAGKTLFMVKPNLMQLTSSFIITDPKGEIARCCSGFLISHGYRVRILNLVEMEHSNGYNPFRYIRSETDIVKLITNLIANTTPKNASSNDPFWEKAESLYLQAIFLYVWMECSPEERNFRTVLKLLNEAEVHADGSPSDLDRRFRRLERKKGGSHPALIQYNKVVRGAGDTVRSIIISANARLGILENPQILRILDSDEMDIPEIGTGIDGDKNKKTALFCVIPDSDKSYNFLVGMLYSQIFQELYYQADFHYNGRLPIHVTFMLDEFSNVALPDDFCSLLSTMRSREISCIIIIQNLAQIKALFKDTWETIPGNCDTLIYLGGNEQSTHKYISESLGKGTIDKRSSGETKGRNGSSSRNYDVLGRELLTPDETRKLDNHECIILIRGCDPVIDRKYNTFQHPLFKESEDGGAPPYVHDIKEAQKRDTVRFLSVDSLQYFKKKKQEGEPVHILELSLEEVFASSPIPEKIFEKEELEENRKEAGRSIKEIRKDSQDHSEKEGGTASQQGEAELFDLLAKNPYSDAQLEEIRAAISDGIPYKDILVIADIRNTSDQMQELRMRYTKDVNS
ncbi:MAG: type IV secretory system conjugative DNA transfer family protein [Lachnospiraceae bacterium]|jgi:type IV secretion system protein VirD4|nr:type IV secretory system conjugative DNA transfer family protein [Lachnospiraceae bacterium]